MTDVSSVAYRTMGPRAALTGPGDSLENINTNPLPDGASCFVIENRSNYRLDKLSVAAPAPPTIIAPGLGPGRWFQDVSGGGDIDPLSNVFYVDGGTTVPVPDQDGAISAPFISVVAALAAIIPAVTQPTFLVTPDDYLALHTVTASCTIQGITTPVNVNGPVFNWVNLGAVAVSADVITFFVSIRILGPTTLGANATASFANCSLGSFASGVGNINAEECSFTQDVSAAQIALTKCTSSAGVDFTATGTITLDSDTLIQGNVVCDSAIIRNTRWAAVANLTCTNDLTIDQASYDNALKAGVTITVGGTTTIIDPPTKLKSVWYVDTETDVSDNAAQDGTEQFPFSTLAAAVAAAADGDSILVAPVYDFSGEATVDVENRQLQIQLIGPERGLSVGTALPTLLMKGGSNIYVEGPFNVTASDAAEEGGILTAKNCQVLDVAGCALVCLDCIVRGTITQGAASLSAEYRDCLIDAGTTTMDLITLRRCEMSTTTLVTDVLNTDWFSYQTGISGSVTFTIATTIDIIGGAPKETIYWTADNGHIVNQFASLYQFQGNSDPNDESPNEITRRGTGRLGVIYAMSKNGNVGADRTFMLRKNRADTTVTVTIANGTDFGTADASALTWVQGDTFSIQMDTVIGEEEIDIAVDFYANDSPTFTL